MKNILQTVAILPFLVTSAFAATSPTINCQTVLGTKSIAKVPTKTVTTTSSVRPTQKLIRQSTVTVYKGMVSTLTVLTTETETVTDSTVTDTFSTTTTLYDVQTLTDTSTITTTTTQTSTTSSTSTTTVATTPGFHNIADTLNSDSLRKRNNPKVGRSPAKRAVKKGAQGVLAQSFPAQVTCTKTKPNTNTKTVYTTLKPTTTVIAYWSRSITELDTLTTTSTVIPGHASFTETDTSTSTVSTTITTISTAEATTSTTTTSILPGPTVYDACNPNNIWGANFKHAGTSYYAVNVANNGPGVSSDFQILADGAGTAVDCCNACQQLDICETFIFRPRNRNCFLLKHDGATCSSQFNHPNFILSKKGTDPGDGYTVGNGNCGYTYSGNSDSTVYTVDQ